MKKKATKTINPDAPTGNLFQNISIVNNHPPLPDAHVGAVIAIVRACEENARTLAEACKALRGPENNSIGLKIESAG